MSYLSTVLADNPLHYWRLSEQGGSILHDIGSSPLHLGFQPVTPNVLGYSGIAGDGGSVWIDSGFAWRNHDPIAVSSPWSAEMWVWLIANTQTVRFLLDSGGSGSVGMDLALSAADHFAADWNAGHVTGPLATPRSWHHLVATYNGATLILYVDGVNSGSAAVATAGGNAQICIGATSGFTLGFSAGVACEVALYNAVLSPARVTAHFLAQEYGGVPVFGNSGFVGSVGGGGAVDTGSSLILQIWNAVHKVY